MVIALAGYNGFIGSHIRKRLHAHDFIMLSRDDLYGSASALARKISGSDVLINTAGFRITARWTKKNREKIHSSRIVVTRQLVQAISLAEQKPAVFMTASAIGIYRNQMEHTEDSRAYADDFLAKVVRDWEAAADTVTGDVRLVKMRFGMVLGGDGGALPKLLRLFKWGLGGVIASGKQVYSFIHIEDLTGAIAHILEQKGEGVYNFTAPVPVTSKTFTNTIAKKLHRPAMIPSPGFLMQIVMGKAAIVVTKGQTVYPKKLLDEGYKFTFATIDEAIENLAEQ
ncbi:MAG: TIGR01777 family oxidoreductase [Bacteroidales bacterium]|nr:TIGR01777 family oxidoreductase [Bacteroidales bacterium]MDT8431176.1 TIGR01777 family oxidoreductase [Bacteroidales bacterium]